MVSVNSWLKQIVDFQPYPLLFATVSGAHLYGFASADSDYDLRGVHILPLPLTVGLQTPEETIQVAEDIDGLELDLVTHDLHKFFRLLLKRNGYVLEQLYSPLIVYSTPEHDELKKIARGCITRHHAHHYLGFAQTQWCLLNKKNPSRVKPLLYLYRVLLTGIYLMRTGKIEANLNYLNREFKLPYIPDLIALKASGTEKEWLCNLDLEFHQSEYLGLREKLTIESQNSQLPELPTLETKSALNDLLVRIRLDN
ncbi:MAG: nucleotidyltransferase domain-containing protein [Cyanobacteria bacterium J06623_7]